MMRLAFFVMFGLLLSMTAVALTSAENSIAGDWVGAIEVSQHLPVRVHFEPKGDAMTGTVMIFPEGIFDVALTKVEMDADHVNFELQTEGGPVSFSGVRKENTISGDFTRGDQKGTFQMVQLIKVDPQRYFGIYELEPGRFIYIRTWDELGDNQLTYFDDSSRVGPIYASSDTDFFSGPGIWIPLPAQLRVTFTKDGSGVISGLSWSENGSPAKMAKKISSCKEEEVSFQSAGIRLSGSLVLPEGPGPHPAIVLVHGSGPVTRDFFGPLAYIFARHGIAALTYDKRGIGKSEGDWLDAGFEDLAADALAGVQLLRNRKEIDSVRIGLFGISQSGWILPLAALQHKEIAFLVLVSSPAVTPAQQQLMAAEEEMRVQGMPEDQIREAVAKQKSDMDYLRTEEARQKYEEEIQKLKEQGDQKTLSVSGLENPRFLLFYRRILDFDPLPFLEKVNCPVLAIYGDLDRGVPIAGNRERLEGALKRAGNSDYLIKIFSKGDHALMMGETGSWREFPYLNQFVPGFFDTMINWINSHVRSKRASTGR